MQSRIIRFAVSPLTPTFDICAQICTSQRLIWITRGKNSCQIVGITKRSSPLAWLVTIHGIITSCALSWLKKAVVDIWYKVAGMQLHKKKTPPQLQNAPNVWKCTVVVQALKKKKKRRTETVQKAARSTLMGENKINRKKFEPFYTVKGTTRGCRPHNGDRREVTFKMENCNLSRRQNRHPEEPEETRHASPWNADKERAVQT